jgi:hypothetical protein
MTGRHQSESMVAISRCGHRNRPFRSNGFKQSYLARTDVVSVGKIETKPKAGIVHEDFSTG